MIATVHGLTAVAWDTPATGLAHAAVEPLRNLTIVLIVQATSRAVSGRPSDHRACRCSVNVITRPSCEVRHDVA